MSQARNGTVAQLVNHRARGFLDVYVVLVLRKV